MHAMGHSVVSIAETFLEKYLWILYGPKYYAEFDRINVEAVHIRGMRDWSYQMVHRRVAVLLEYFYGQRPQKSELYSRGNISE